MKIRTERGFLILADISGFTAFLTATELEHGPPIIAALLEEVIREFSPPLEIQEVEGDAVFALGPDRVLVSPVVVLDVVESAFAAFRRRQREMQAAETCSCRVCQSISTLSLKIITHHGAFLRQTVGGRSQAAGTDVILAHRLLKNRSGRAGAYLLLTESALRYLGLDPAGTGLGAHTERFEHLGDVRCFVGDPGEAWRPRGADAATVAIGAW
jgi:Protein of unknown function (DUF2652)